MLTVSTLEQRLLEAAQSVCRLPPHLPASLLDSWPHAVSNTYKGYVRTQHHPLTLPLDSQALQEMNETLGWLKRVREEDQRIVWMRSLGLQWRVIGEWLDCSRPYLQKRYKESLKQMKTLSLASCPLARQSSEGGLAGTSPELPPAGGTPPPFALRQTLKLT